MGNRSIEHRQNLRHRGHRPATIDRLPVALAKLPEKMPQRERRGEFARSGQHRSAVAILLGHLLRRSPAAERGLKISVHLLSRFVGDVLPVEIEIDRRAEGLDCGPLIGPGIVGDKREDGIPQLLGGKALECRRGEGGRSLHRRVVGDGPALVGVGRDDQPYELAQVKFEPQHLVGEMFQKLRMRRGILRAEVVDRLDHSHPHQQLPHPVGDRAGKLPVVAAGQPRGKLFPPGSGLRRSRDLPPQHPRLHRGERLGIGILVVVRQLERQRVISDHGAIGIEKLKKLLVDLRSPRLFGIFAGLAGKVADVVPRGFQAVAAGRFLRLLAGLLAELAPQPGLRAGSERGQFIKLMLRPGIKWMVVALGTADLRAQKHPHGVVNVGERHPQIAQLEAHRRALPKLAVGGEHFVNPLVVRPVGGDRPLHPVEIGFKKEIPLRPLLQPQYFRPRIVKPADVVWALQQAFNQFSPFVGAGRLEKGLRFVKRRNPSAEIEIDAAQKLLVGQLRARLHARLCMPLGQQAVEGGSRLLHTCPPVGVDRQHLKRSLLGRLENRCRKPRRTAAAGCHGLVLARPE